MTFKQADRFFHRNCRVLANGRYAITYCSKTLEAPTESRLRRAFHARHADFREMSGEHLFIGIDLAVGRDKSVTVPIIYKQSAV